ncbi:MAG TPA: hypothetical protein VEF76_06265 [Patescibacteria group bacterium]|nr:hypothetical protein [Patescibacteria group bacterium]
MIYPECAQGLIEVSLQALKEFSQTGEVSRPTRERFLLEDTKDRLRLLQDEMAPTEFRELYERTLGQLSAKFTGMESLAYISTPVPTKGPR